MSISLSVLIIIYLILVAIFAVFAFFNLYHLWRFGFMSFEGFFMTFIFLAGTFLILFITYDLALSIDWSAPLINFNLGIFNSSDIIGN